MPRFYKSLAVLSIAVLTAGCGAGGAATIAEPEDPAPALSAEPITDGLTAHRPTVSGVNGLITAGHPLASMAGMRILMQGGTAADAAVAVLATLNQVEPMMSGAGGNGFMTIYDAETDRVYSLNATGAAPKGLDAATITPDELNRGMKAGVVPGLFGGWIAMLERFGTMTLGQVLEPAIEYAERGHPLDAFVAASIARSRDLFERYPSTAAVFLPAGEPPVEGHLFRYPDLARTFHKLVEAEETARLDRGSRKTGLRAGVQPVLSRRHRPRHDPVSISGTADCSHARTSPPTSRSGPSRSTRPTRGYDVYSSPTTSRGGLEVVMQLNLIEGFDVASLGHNSAAALHLIAESIKVAKSDIYHFVTDPKHADMPTAGMTSKAFADTRRALISSGHVIPYPDHGAPPGAEIASTSASLGVAVLGPMLAQTAYPGSTTSFSIVDRQGNVVVATPTLGKRLGNGGRGGEHRAVLQQRAPGSGRPRRIPTT